MKIVMVPMDDDLAAMGVCCHCHQDFDGDEFYCQVATDNLITETTVVWLVCVGCAAQLACKV
jgi:hypothetical protein